MWERFERLPGRWLDRKEALAYLGISGTRFNLLVADGWIDYRGNGNGRRFYAEHVAAVATLWKKLDALFPEPKKGEEDEDSE